MLNKKVGLLAVGMLAVGALGSVAVQSFAQTTTTSTPASPTIETSRIRHHGHAPLGNDGIVASINGTTIVMNEEADEGGASYTIDASKATFTKDGAASTIASIVVGDKVFVEGAVNGTNVTATTVSNGHGGFMGHHDKPEAKDANGKDIETNDDAGSTTQTQ